MGDRGTEDRGIEELRHRGIEGWRDGGIEDLYVVCGQLFVEFLCRGIEDLYVDCMEFRIPTRRCAPTACGCMVANRLSPLSYEHFYRFARLSRMGFCARYENSDQTTSDLNEKPKV